MSNLIDYVNWRGDLSVSAVPVGEVDGLILAQCSMFRWENALDGSGVLRDVAPLLQEEPVSVGFTAENDKKLLDLLESSKRFGNILLSDYVHETDERSEMQFAAITLHLGKDLHYISFRGTDNSVVGWKEDFNMAFSRPVPAQEAAADYLRFIAGKFAGTFLVGGHSKGGNLAMYASATIEDNVRDRIRAIYNYDGPGLSDKMDAPMLYSRINSRLHSFVPQGSVIGMLLAHPDQYSVVKSNSVSILQHDPYSWQVEQGHFLHLPAVAGESARFEAAFQQWLCEVNETERAELVESLFEVIDATNAQNFGREFWIGLAQNSKAVWKAMSDIGPEKRARVKKMITDLGRLAMQDPEENKPI